MTKLMCVGLVATVMMPLGRDLYPYIDGALGSLQFDTLEAIFSATAGFALYAAMFG